MELYSLDIANRTPTAYNEELVDQETYKLKLKLRLYRELILFNFINFRSSDIMLEFLYLKSINSSIFWVEEEVVFFTTLYINFSFQTVLKKRLLYFNIMAFKELEARLQKKKLDIKLLWYKDNR